VENGRFLNLRW